MRSGTIGLLGILLAFAAAWVGLVAAPYRQLDRLRPVAAFPGADLFPQAGSGLAAMGRQVYVANGCVDCHTQQVRPKRSGSDLAREWGPRRSVPRDYLNDQPPLLGSHRVGPDLLNVGARRTDANWHHLHLYNPRTMSPGSMMPSFRFLYERRKIVGQPTHRAIQFPADRALKAGYEVVPTPEATALVAYLLSLDHTVPLREAGTP
ncbi:MAG: cbb3-type cytochrome c oxidase subunit II [Isosphaeraceae bacterium]